MWACGLWGELALIVKYIYLIYIWRYLIVGYLWYDYICIFIGIWGTYLLSGSLDMEVYIRVYIWKYLACNLKPRFLFSAYTCGVGLKWNSCVVTLTVKCVARPAMLYMSERMYATKYVVRSLILLSLWGRTKRTCIMINHSLHTCIVRPLISHLFG